MPSRMSPETECTGTDHVRWQRKMTGKTRVYYRLHVGYPAIFAGIENARGKHGLASLGVHASAHRFGQARPADIRPPMRCAASRPTRSR